MATQPILLEGAFAAIVICMAEAKSFARKSKIKVPVRPCHPMARLVFAEMKRQGVTYDALEWSAGVLRSTFKAWRTNNRPGLDTIEAALGALGWDVLPVPKPDRLDPAVRADLEAVAEKHGLDVIPNGQLVAACIGYRHPDSNVHALPRAKAA